MRPPLVLLDLDELDRMIDRIDSELLPLLLRPLDILERIDDLVVGEKALFLARFDELLKFFDVGKSNVDSEHLSTTSGHYAG